MNKVWTMMLICASLGVFTACDDDDDDNRPDLTDTDETFVERAARANLTEVEFGELASQQATDPAVRAFAQQMIDEHTTAQNELKTIADKYDDVDWPTGMDEQHRQLRETLTSLTGYPFDSAYMVSQVMDHENTRALFQNAVDDADEPEVKAYATKYLPHIEQHLTEATQIRDALLVTETSN